MKHLRALFVLFHLLAIFLLSFPAPVGGMTEASFKHPATQQSFRSYAEALQGVGLDIDAAQLEAALWELGTRYMKARAATVAPFEPYLLAVGAKQGWRMFHSVNREPAWLVVEIHPGPTLESGAWRRVYESRSDSATWRRPQLDQERSRALMNSWSWLSSKKTYHQFGAWLAQRAAEDFPEAMWMRTTLERRVIPGPEQLRRSGLPTPTVHWERRYALEALR